MGEKKQKIHKQKHSSLAGTLCGHPGHWPAWALAKLLPTVRKDSPPPLLLGETSPDPTFQAGASLWLVQLPRKRGIKYITRIFSFCNGRWSLLHEMRYSPHIGWESRNWAAKMKKYPLPISNKALRRLAKIDPVW